MRLSIARGHARVHPRATQCPFAQDDGQSKNLPLYGLIETAGIIGHIWSTCGSTPFLSSERFQYDFEEKILLQASFSTGKSLLEFV